jgi:hypothetical protein
MDLELLNREISKFSKESHGSSNYHQDELFVMGRGSGEFAPLKYLVKKVEGAVDAHSLVKLGFIHDSYELFEIETFAPWFEKQFSRKLLRKHARLVSILHLPDTKTALATIEAVNRCYETLRQEQILFNNKNLPVQLGEWYAKFIFGLQQKKSTSQRGFDFYVDSSRVEVRVQWGDLPSPKGVKIRKSMAELSKHAVIIYLANNFMIREVCYLDCDFILRKFSCKGHTIFLKDGDIESYFFSKSSKHFDKVVNSGLLLQFANPALAIKLAEKFE